MAKKASFHDFIQMLEKSWNKAARAYIEKERLKVDPDSFRISAQVDYKNERGITARVQAGPVNQIYITFPQKNYQRTLTKVFDYISNPNVHRDEDLEERRFVGSVVHELYSSAIWKRKSKNGKNRHWRKADIFDKRNPAKSLIKKRRDNSEFVAEVEVVNTVKVRHKDSGIYVTIVDNEGREVWDMLQEAYHSCSLKVHEIMEERKKLEEKPARYDLVPIAYYQQVEFKYE